MSETVKKYGEMAIEKDIKDTQRCREVVQEIMRFGVKDRDIIKIVHMLSLNLEDREAMLALSAVAKDLLQPKFDDDPKEIIV